MTIIFDGSKSNFQMLRNSQVAKKSRFYDNDLILDQMVWQRIKHVKVGREPTVQFARGCR